MIYKNSRYINSFYVDTLIQNVLITTHGLIGSSHWYISLFSFTLIFRSLLLPIVRIQLINNQKILSPIVQAQLSHLNRLYIGNIRPIVSKNYEVSNHNALFQSTRLYIRGFKGIMKMNNIKPILSVILPFIQIPVFVSYVYAIRGMINSADNDILLSIKQQLQNGGTLWFQDLTIPDPYFILPMIAIGSTYLSLEFSLSSASITKPKINKENQQKQQILVLPFIKNTFQTILILSFPITAGLPSGVFMYWIPSSIFSICQTLAFNKFISYFWIS